jgi:aryl sulfotransferase
MARDGYPFWSFWDNVRTWWQIRDLPNVRLVHFSELKRDLPGTIRQIARFLQIPVNESHWSAILEHCSFEWMKQNATKSVPLGNGRWADVLTAEEAAEYEQIAVSQLGPACAQWLATGELATR